MHHQTKTWIILHMLRQPHQVKSNNHLYINQLAMEFIAKDIQSLFHIYQYQHH